MVASGTKAFFMIKVASNCACMYTIYLYIHIYVCVFVYVGVSVCVKDIMNNRLYIIVYYKRLRACTHQNKIMQKYDYANCTKTKNGPFKLFCRSELKFRVPFYQPTQWTAANLIYPSHV